MNHSQSTFVLNMHPELADLLRRRVEVQGAIHQISRYLDGDHRQLRLQVMDDQAGMSVYLPAEPMRELIEVEYNKLLQEQSRLDRVYEAVVQALEKAEDEGETKDVKRG